MDISENVSSTIECIVALGECGPDVAIESLHNLSQVYPQLASPLITIMTSGNLNSFNILIF